MILGKMYYLLSYYNIFLPRYIICLNLPNKASFFLYIIWHILVILFRKELVISTSACFEYKMLFKVMAIFNFADKS